MTIASISQLPVLRDHLDDRSRTVFDRLFYLEQTMGHTVPPATMEPWIERHFGTVSRVVQQTIIRVTNRLTLESAIYNPIRGKRPLDEGKVVAEKRDDLLEEQIAAYGGASDMFQRPLQETPADVFGRIAGQYCITSSNVAKFDGLHGLVIFNEYHPLRFSREQLYDYFAVALRWFVQAQQQNPAACYPLITWNCLWKSGASITHGHMQMTLSQGMAHGQVERWRRASVMYAEMYQADLAADLWHVHQQLGLGFCDFPDVHGYVTLTPVKDREVRLVSGVVPFSSLVDGELGDEAQQMYISALQQRLVPLWDATYATLRNFIEHQGVRSFNLAVYLPPLTQTAEEWLNPRAYVRIVDRGDPLSRMVNLGAMEMFAASIISVNPFEVAHVLRTLPVLQ